MTRIQIYDIEVFSDDWVVVFRNPDSDSHTVIHNDNYHLREFLSQPDILIGGYNNKHYDDWVIFTMLLGGSNIDVKKHNDHIIGGGDAWTYPTVQYKKRPFKSFDLKDDVRIGTSLKEIEGHMGKPIVESSVPFDINRPLTDEELREVIEYCKTDVDNTVLLYKTRENYLNCKINLGEMSGLSAAESLSLTNAKLTAKYLGAELVKRNDGRQYVYPKELRKELIPNEIIAFFDKIRDMSISDEDLFSRKLEIKIGGCPCVYAWGGVHGSLKSVYFIADNDTVIQNRDVSSLYPSLLIEYNYISRNCKDPSKYRRTKDRRIEAKHEGDKKTANTLKNPLNVTSGAMEARFNDLYDPLMARSMRISGQLLLTMLVVELVNECETFRLINFNTDGLMYTVSKRELSKVDEICTKWERETRFELETDDIEKVYIKDVNNLIFRKTNGEVKKVGSYLNHGISEKGAFSINNNYTIVKDAIASYFMDGTPVEETITSCDDIFAFQIIAKTGDTYHGTFHEVDGKRVNVQKVNRVYAITDERYGTIKKTKKDGRVDKIASLPEHCIIDNDNQLTVRDIDKQFYIELAKKMIGDYLGKKRVNPTKSGGKKMTTKKETASNKVVMNIYEKLALARHKFLNSDVKKSGINRFAEYKYFELSDIVPPATTIFGDLGLVFLISFTNEEAIGTLVNSENPEEVIEFKSPMRNLEVKGMNAIQALGGVETYQRRYLYMTCLDIVEADAFDATQGKPGSESSESAPKKSNKPATPEQREEVKNELINSSGEAEEVQIKSIKNALKKLRTKDGDKYEPYIIEIVKLMKAGLTKEKAESLLIEIGEKITE